MVRQNFRESITPMGVRPWKDAMSLGVGHSPVLQLPCSVSATLLTALSWAGCESPPVLATACNAAHRLQQQVTGY